MTGGAAGLPAPEPHAPCPDSSRRRARAAAGALLAAAVGLTGAAATAGPEAWAEFAQLFKESRFVSVTSVDFLTLTLLAPLWVLNDAQVRRWDSPLLPLLLALPVVGPAAYLVLRPRAE